ncbi:Rubredoxin-like domain-containing protein, partial [Dysosmobacter welbionis]
RESGQQAAGIDGSTCGRFAEKAARSQQLRAGCLSVVDFAEDPGDSNRQEDTKQHPAAGQHGKEQQEGGGLRIIKIGEDRHQMGGGVQISAQKEEQPQ